MGDRAGQGGPLAGRFLRQRGNPSLSGEGERLGSPFIPGHTARRDARPSAGSEGPPRVDPRRSEGTSRLRRSARFRMARDRDGARPGGGTGSLVYGTQLGRGPLDADGDPSPGRSGGQLRLSPHRPRGLRSPLDRHSRAARRERGRCRHACAAALDGVRAHRGRVVLEPRRRTGARPRPDIRGKSKAGGRDELPAAASLGQGLGADEIHDRPRNRQLLGRPGEQPGKDGLVG